MKTKIYAAESAHEALYQDLSNIMRKYQHLSPQEMLAIASNMVGKLVALQDQRKLSPEEAMEIVGQNIEKGNRDMIERLQSGKGGTA